MNPSCGPEEASLERTGNNFQLRLKSERKLFLQTEWRGNAEGPEHYRIHSVCTCQLSHISTFTISMKISLSVDAEALQYVLTISYLVMIRVYSSGCVMHLDFMS